MIVLWCLIEKNVFKFGFEKRGILNKIPFLHKAFHGYFWKGMTSFYHETSSLICNQTFHRTNIFRLIGPTLAMSQTMSAFVL